MTPGLRIKKSADNCREQKIQSITASFELHLAMRDFNARKGTLFILRKSPSRYNEHLATELTMEITARQKNVDF